MLALALTLLRIRRIHMFLGHPDPLVRSGSFYYQAKIVRKTLIPTVLWLIFDFLSLKNYVNVPSKRNKQKTSLRSLTKIVKSVSASESASGSISQRYGSADPDPYQNFIDLPISNPPPPPLHVPKLLEFIKIIPAGGMRQARTFRFRQERFVPCQNVLFQVYTFDQNTTLI